MPELPEEFAACHFYVDIEGETVALFNECSGLEGEVEVETYREGGLNEYEHKLPGPARFGNVTLRGGVANSMELWKWFHAVSTGEVERRNMSIMLYFHDRGEAMRWNLKGAYPVRWQGPEFRADDNSVALQSLELAHREIEMVKR